MWKLIELYQSAMVAAVVFAAALALTGCHLAGRDRSMQTLCISQGAMLGVLLGLGIGEALPFHDETMHITTPFFAAIIAAVLVYVLTARISAGRVAAKNTYFTAVFASLLAAGYLVSALFPGLENHMAQRFFGDLATLSSSEAQITIGFAAAILAAHACLWKHFAADSFNLAILGESSLSARRTWSPAAFDLLALVAICFAVQFVGFLFTVTCLFLPTTLMSFTRGRSLTRHLAACGVVAVVGAFSGFIISLARSNLSTVPSIVAAMLVLGALGLLVERTFTRSPVAN